MLKTLFAGALALFTLTSAAQAKPRLAFHPDCNITMPCIGAPPPSYLTAKPARETRRSARTVSITGTMTLKVTRRPPGESIDRAIGVNPTLAGKVSSIQAACPGTNVISGLRHTRVAGTNRMSLHASGNAVDVRGPYGCIYAQLRGWPGGYSTDAGRVNHIHISYDATSGREMGLKFAHRGGKKKRYAHRHKRLRSASGH